MAMITMRIPEQDNDMMREQFNALCANITFAGPNIKTAAMTSCQTGDGKSFISMHAAMNFANRGKKVVLIDADLRKSRMATDYSFQCSKGEIVGLAHYLAGGSSLNDVLHQTNIHNLFLIPAGRNVANPIPLLTAPGFQKMIERLEQICDLILIDTPPIRMVVDAVEIARYTNGIIFVTKFQKTRRRELKEAITILGKAEVPILGCILNQVEYKGITSKYYYFHYYERDYYQKDDNSNS